MFLGMSDYSKVLRLLIHVACFGFVDTLQKKLTCLDYHWMLPYASSKVILGCLSVCISNFIICFMYICTCIHMYIVHMFIIFLDQLALVSFLFYSAKCSVRNVNVLIT